MFVTYKEAYRYGMDCMTVKIKAHLVVVSN